MVLRHLPILLLSVLSLVCAVAAPAAHAQQAATNTSDGNGAYSDDDGSYWGPDDAYDGDDEYADDSDGAQPYDDGATGGQTPGVTTTTTQPATTAVPGQTSPSRQPTGTLPPTTGTLPTIPVTRTIAGKVAELRTDGKAAIPRGAPKVVQAVIAAANRIIGKPYKWGGGHAKLIDKGYDCSGSVSFALIGAGLLASPMVSGTLAHWDAAGNGRWISVYANNGHVYMEVAGLRLDTSPVGDATGRMGVRWRPLIGRRTGFHTRHPLGL